MKITTLSTVAACAIAGLALSACTAGNGPKASDTAAQAPKHKYEVKFHGIHAPVTDEEKRVNRASEFVEINGVTYPIGYNVIARTGDAFKSGVFGRVMNKKGAPIMEGSQPWDSVDMDHSTLLPRMGKKGEQNLFMITQFESAPAAMYMTTLHQDKSSGKLIAVDTQSIDASGVEGVWVPCAGMRTPWLTHLGSEEYEPDARLVEEGKGEKVYKWSEMVRYYENPAEANPYNYGYSPELDIAYSKEAKAWQPSIVKHYTMGRFAKELAYVMPDNKTVYMSDDGTNVGLFMFVADKPADLSSGELFAAKWIQKSDENGGAADIKWVSLGHATDAQIKKDLDTKIKFSDIFEYKAPENGKCSTGYRSVNIGHESASHECLKLKPGMWRAASRLETRRYAAYMGATTEFRKEEGITFDAQTNKLYVVMSRIQYGMENNMKGGKENNKYDIGGSNDIKLPYNDCGVVYALDVKKGVKSVAIKKNKPEDVSEIKSEYVAVNMVAEIAGKMDKNKGTPYEGANKCHIDGLSEPDNATMIQKSNVLVIGEDTGGGHQNDAVWAYDLDGKKLTRIFTAPYGSETTSPFWYGDVNGYGYMMVVTQHPYGEGDAVYSEESKDENWIGKIVKSPAEPKGYVGYVGPFPSMK